nr:splicing factor 3b subunit 6-like protein [Quercus suber]
MSSLILSTVHLHGPPSRSRLPNGAHSLHLLATLHISQYQAMNRGGKLSAEVNRALFVKNLAYDVSTEDLFDLFGKFGPIRQIRQGIATTTKGTAFVVYEDVMDAKAACDKLNGFNFQKRYLVVLYHQQSKANKSQLDLAERQENLEKLKQEHGIA